MGVADLGTSERIATSGNTDSNAVKVVYKRGKNKKKKKVAYKSGYKRGKVLNLVPSQCQVN